MTARLRHPQIVEIAHRRGRVTVEDLAERFGVTLQTIRRDLGELAEAGRLERVHGGAVLPSGTSNLGHEVRRVLEPAAKASIAAACAAAIPDACSVFLGIGTSVEAVARALSGRRELMVVTNNMIVAETLARTPDAQVILSGGSLRRADGGLVGPLAMGAIDQFKLDVAVIGCSALDEEGDLLDFDVQEVGVNQTILRRSRRTFLVADASKLTRTAPVRIASLGAIHTLFTDRPLPAPLAARCAEWGVRVAVAPPIGTRAFSTGAVSTRAG